MMIGNTAATATNTTTTNLDKQTMYQQQERTSYQAASISVVDDQPAGTFDASNKSNHTNSKNNSNSRTSSRLNHRGSASSFGGSSIRSSLNTVSSFGTGSRRVSFPRRLHQQGEEGEEEEIESSPTKKKKKRANIDATKENQEDESFHGKNSTATNSNNLTTRVTGWTSFFSPGKTSKQTVNIQTDDGLDTIGSTSNHTTTRRKKKKKFSKFMSKTTSRSSKKNSQKQQHPSNGGVLSTTNEATSILARRLEELLILELHKDGSKTYLHLSTRALYQHVINAITNKESLHLATTLTAADGTNTKNISEFNQSRNSFGMNNNSSNNGSFSMMNNSNATMIHRNTTTNSSGKSEEYVNTLLERPASSSFEGGRRSSISGTSNLKRTTQTTSKQRRRGSVDYIGNTVVPAATRIKSKRRASTATGSSSYEGNQNQWLHAEQQFQNQIQQQQQQQLWQSNSMNTSNKVNANTTFGSPSTLTDVNHDNSNMNSSASLPFQSGSNSSYRNSTGFVLDNIIEENVTTKTLPTTEGRKQSLGYMRYDGDDNNDDNNYNSNNIRLNSSHHLAQIGATATTNSNKTTPDNSSRHERTSIKERLNDSSYSIDLELDFNYNPGDPTNNNSATKEKKTDTVESGDHVEQHHQQQTLQHNTISLKTMQATVPPSATIANRIVTTVAQRQQQSFQSEQQETIATDKYGVARFSINAPPLSPNAKYRTNRKGSIGYMGASFRPTFIPPPSASSTIRSSPGNINACLQHNNSTAAIISNNVTTFQQLHDNSHGSSFASIALSPPSSGTISAPTLHLSNQQQGQSQLTTRSSLSRQPSLRSRRASLGLLPQLQNSVPSIAPPTTSHISPLPSHNPIQYDHHHAGSSGGYLPSPDPRTIPIHGNQYGPSSPTLPVLNPQVSGSQLPHGMMMNPNNNNSTIHNVTYRERLGSYLHPRDMRKLVTPFSTNSKASNNEPELIIRRHVMLLNFDPLRAIILRDRMLIIVPDGADSVLHQIEKRVRGGQEEVENSIFGSVSLQSVTEAAFHSYNNSPSYSNGSCDPRSNINTTNIVNKLVHSTTVQPNGESAINSRIDDNNIKNNLAENGIDINNNNAADDDESTEVELEDDSSDDDHEEEEDDDDSMYDDDFDDGYDETEFDEMEGREWIDLPFELQCVDAVLYVVNVMLSDETSALQKHALEVLDELQLRNFTMKDDPLTTIHAIKDSTRELMLRVNAFIESMNRILDEDKLMALMNLSRLLTHPERFIQPVPNEVLDEESDEPELLLEANLQIGLTLLNVLESVQGKVDTASQTIDQRLSTMRNQILYADMLVSVATLSVATASLVGSLFGMNLYNSLEENNYAFRVVVTSTIIGAMILTFAIYLGLVYSGTIPGPPMLMMGMMDKNRGLVTRDGTNHTKNHEAIRKHRKQL